MFDIAISNLAWRPQEDAAALALLRDFGISQVEASPYRLWPDPVSEEGPWPSYPADLLAGGFKIQAFQALLYNHPELTIFTSPASRAATQRYLEKSIDLAARLGVSALVFGAPRHKLIGRLDRAKAWEIAGAFFSALARRAAAAGLIFCLEPTPTEYGADFITTHQEALELISEIDSPGLKLNLDLGAARINGENVLSILHESFSNIGHIHLSEPQLRPLVPDRDYHFQIAGTLQELGYVGGLAIEQLAGEKPGLPTVRSALTFVQEIYGGR